MARAPALPPVAPPGPAQAVSTGVAGRWVAAGAFVLAALSAAALAFAWSAQQRVRTLEAELVRRQQDTGAQAAEARAAARSAQDVARDASAKLALLEARVAETTLQRTQIEELVQSLARSRDENVLADVEASVRVALQQSAITASAEPLVAALRQADERLARYNQPRLERVRRAVVQDLERTRVAGVTDMAVLTIRLDETIRQVDDLPLFSQAERQPSPRAAVRPGVTAASPSGWKTVVGEGWLGALVQIWDEVRSLVRVTRIEQPEAVLLAPDQAFFLRENLKLRLLNARLALLSRQFDTAQLDLRDAQAALERYFDHSSRRVQAAIDSVRQVSQQARLATVPRPDATLAAIATASAGR